MLQKLWNDECGFVISAELVLVLTIGVLAMIVGLHAVAKSITQELNDISSALVRSTKATPIVDYKRISTLLPSVPAITMAWMTAIVR